MDVAVILWRTPAAAAATRLATTSGILMTGHAFLILAALLLGACSTATRQRGGWVYVEQSQNVVMINTERTEVIVTGPHGVILSLADHDGDGAFDLLRYVVYDDSGEELIEVEDYDVNGETDVRWHWKQPSFMELWYSNAWRRLNKRGDEFFLEFDGKVVPVQVENGRFIADDT